MNHYCILCEHSKVEFKAKYIFNQKTPVLECQKRETIAARIYSTAGRTGLFKTRKCVEINPDNDCNHYSGNLSFRGILLAWDKFKLLNNTKPKEKQNEGRT